MGRFKTLAASFKRSVVDLFDKVNLIKQIRELKDQINDLEVKVESVEEITAEDVANRIDLSILSQYMKINYRKLAQEIELDYSELANEFEDIASDVAENISTSDIADHFSTSDIAENISVDISELAELVIKKLVKNYQRQV
jgi:23S rRNA U2552 (ribose-2'-O)-methylase RlmE/FtsJ